MIKSKGVFVKWKVVRIEVQLGGCRIVKGRYHVCMFTGKSHRQVL
jgi:hypothetical protein